MTELVSVCSFIYDVRTDGLVCRNGIDPRLMAIGIRKSSSSSGGPSWYVPLFLRLGPSLTIYPPGRRRLQWHPVLANISIAEFLFQVSDPILSSIPRFDLYGCLLVSSFIISGLHIGFEFGTQHSVPSHLFHLILFNRGRRSTGRAFGTAVDGLFHFIIFGYWLRTRRLYLDQDGMYPRTIQSSTFIFRWILIQLPPSS